MELNQRLDHADLFQNWQVSSAEIASPDDYAVCREIMRAASKNYSFASRFFPAEKLHCTP
jgi:hypothetical protein